MIRRALTENGWVRGLPAADPRITSYKGIPYATPPIGANRWKAPRPCMDWTGECAAYAFAPISMQAPTGVALHDIYTREWAVDPELAMDEDCLYLNIWAPADDKETRPVFIWFFGGALQVGNTAEMEFDGERLARRGCVVVTVNYRLNVFGFLAHPWLTAEAPEAPTNFGFWDQQCAIRWVTRNIAAFGGDPKRITIGGQSAGGVSVGAQISYSGNRGLFQRAVLQSGMFAAAYPGFFCLSTPMQAAQERGSAFFDALGVRTLEEARQIDAATLNRRALAWGEPLQWCAVQDGRFLHDDPNRWYRQSDRVQCSVLMGCTDHEFQLFPAAEDADSLRRFAQTLPGVDADAYVGAFPSPVTKKRIRENGGVCAIEYAERLAAEQCDQLAYLYQFRAEIPGEDHPGAFHSVDLWFFFETLAKCWRPFRGMHYDLARQMCDYWANFIREGTPNGMGSDGQPLPVWPAFDALQPMRMAFDAMAHAEPYPTSPIMRLLLDANSAN